MLELFRDDFGGASLDTTTNWTVIRGAANIAVSGGYCTLTGTSSGATCPDFALKTQPTLTKAAGAFIEAGIQWNYTTLSGYDMGFVINGKRYGFNYQWDKNAGNLNTLEDATWTSFGTSYRATQTILRVEYTPEGSVIFYINGSPVRTKTGITDGAITINTPTYCYDSGKNHVIDYISIGNLVPVSDSLNISEFLSTSISSTLLYGLTSYWKLNESSGDATDSVGSYTLTNTSSTFTTGKINNCATFDGSSKRFNNTSFSTPAAITVSCWVNLTSLPTTDSLRSLVNKYKVGTPSGGFDLGLYNSGGTQKVRFFCAYYTWAAPSSTNGQYDITLSTSTWYHIVGTFDSGGYSKLYINGDLKATGANITGSPSLPNIGASDGFCLGYWQNSNDSTRSRYTDGLIDETGIWSRALSSDEITALYNSGNGLQYPFSSGPANLKTYNTNAKVNIKSINGNPISNCKSLNTNV